MESKIMCYYHNDLDGKTSAAIIKENHPQTELQKCDYSDEFNDTNLIKNYDKVYIVDFSFSKKNMEFLIKNNKEIIWIDHHIKAKESLSTIWNNKTIKGLRDINFSGCELTFKYFYPNKDTSKLCKYVGDIDLWKFQYGEKTKYFIEYADTYLTKIDNLKKILFKRNLSKEIEIGKTIYKRIQIQIEKQFENGFIWKKPTPEFNNLKVWVCNTQLNTSYIGNYALNNTNCQVALIYSRRKNKMIYSLRSKNEIDVNKIASKFGGGGHKNASGFVLDINNQINFN